MATPAPEGEGFSRPNEIPPEARDGQTGDRGLGVSTSFFVEGDVDTDTWGVDREWQSMQC